MKKIFASYLVLVGVFGVLGQAIADSETLFRFPNGADVRIIWGEKASAGIYYMPENRDIKAAKHYGMATVHSLSSPPQRDLLLGVAPEGMTVRKGAEGEPVLVTIGNSSAQTPNGKSTLAIFADGSVVNYPIDKFTDVSFGTTKAGDKMILGASFDKGAGVTKVFLSPNPVPTREESKIPGLVFVTLPGSKILERPSIIDWNAASVVATDAKGKEFDLRVGNRLADSKPGSNAVDLSVFRDSRDLLRKDSVAVAGDGRIVAEPGRVVVTAPPPKVEPQRSEHVEFKNNKLVFKDRTGAEHAIAADYDKAISDSDHGYLSAVKSVQYKDQNYTLLKVFNTKEGNGDGEVFLIRDDGERVRFGFKSQGIEPKVADGVLALPGTERRIDLDRFEMEATRQSKRPSLLKDAMGNPIDPIAEVKSLFKDLSAESLREGEPAKLLPSQEKYLNEKLRPAAAQDGGSIAVYGNEGIGTKETVQGFVDAYTRGAYPEIPRTWRALQLDVGALGTGTGLVGATATREQAIVEFSREIPTFWIAPDFDGLKHVGSSGDDSGSLARLAPHIEDGTVQMIAMTTTPGFTASIATDPKMRSLFQPAEMKEAPRAEIVESLLRWMKKNKRKVPAEGSPELATLQKSLGNIIDLSSQFDAVNGQPRKAERLLKTIYAQKRVAGEGPMLAKADIERGAISLYQADPALFDSKLRAEKLQGMQAHLDDKLTGNSYAKKVAIQGYANVFSRVVPSDKTPRNKTIFAGPPGTGKSATVEISADYIGLHKEVLEMNNYVTKESLEQFLFDVASALRTNAYTVLILDEIEKADKVVQAAALRMMQNGEFSARDSMEGKTSGRSNVQTSNASFQFTTNAAEDYVMETYLGLKKFNEADFRKALTAGGVSSPLLDRIDEVVPVAPFSKKTFRTATERAIAKFEKEYNASPEGSQAPLTIKGREKFVDDLVAQNFEKDGSLPLKDEEGSFKLVNGRLVNRVIKQYLKNPTAFKRAMEAAPKCVDLILELESASPSVYD